MLNRILMSLSDGQVVTDFVSGKNQEKLGIGKFLVLFVVRAHTPLAVVVSDY